MARTADVVVVGAGVIGSSIALELAKSGRRVLVLDKAGGAGHGSTSASSAIIRFTYSTLDAVALAWESKFCWESWAEHLGFRDPVGLAAFRRTGMIHLDVPVMPRERTLRLLAAASVPYEEFDADELVRRFPQLDNGRHWPNKPVTDDAFWAASTTTLGGFYTPDAGFVDDPSLAAQNLATAAAGVRGTVPVPHLGDRVAPVPLRWLEARPCRRNDRGLRGRGERGGTVVRRAEPARWRGRGVHYRSPSTAPGGPRGAGAPPGTATATWDRRSPTSISAPTCVRACTAPCSSGAPSPSATASSGSTTRTTPTRG